MELKDYFIENTNFSMSEELLNECNEQNESVINDLKNFFLEQCYENLDEDFYKSLEMNFNKIFTESKKYNKMINIVSTIKETNEYLLNIESLLPETQSLINRHGSLYESALSNFLCIMESNKEEIKYITEDSLVYDELIQKLQEAKENNTPINEGIFGALMGGLTGATVGPTIMNAVCKALGIDPKGSMGNLFTSRLICTAVAGYVGWKA